MNAAVGTRFTDSLFLLLGVLSIFVAALSLVVQRKYKRMLAYSSIEHIGLICVGLALGPLGTFAAMLHLLNHALAKSMMFATPSTFVARIDPRTGAAERQTIELGIDTARMHFFDPETGMGIFDVET